MGLLDFMKNKDKAVDYTDNQNLDDDLPNLEAEDDNVPLLEEPLSAAAKRAKQREEEFRVRETKTDTGTHELPSVNRRAGGNKLVTILGFIFIIGAAIALFTSVNGDKKPKEKKQVTETITNTLPPLVIPKEPVAIDTTPATSSFVSNSAGIDPKTGKPFTNNAAPIDVVSNKNAFHNTRAMGANGRPVMTAAERKMGGDLVVPTKSTNAAAIARRENENAPKPEGGLDNSELAVRLQPTITKMASASLLPNRDFVITKGTPLDCALETALDSSLAGLATCVLSRDAYSDNGKVLLMERGTKLVGEYDGKIKRGQVRLFLLWSRAKTPNGVVINLNSPSTDALGRTGLDGWTDTHFAERFGSAILISLLSDTVKIISQNESQGNNGGTNIYGDSSKAGEKITESILKEQANIPTTILKNQGDHIEIMVARDLDFSSVYNLKEAE